MTEIYLTICLVMFRISQLFPYAASNGLVFVMELHSLYCKVGNIFYLLIKIR